MSVITTKVRRPWNPDSPPVARDTRVDMPAGYKWAGTALVIPLAGNGPAVTIEASAWGPEVAPLITGLCIVTSVYCRLTLVHPPAPFNLWERAVHSRRPYWFLPFVEGHLVSVGPRSSKRGEVVFSPVMSNGEHQVLRCVDVPALFRCSSSW